MSGQKPCGLKYKLYFDPAKIISAKSGGYFLLVHLTKLPFDAIMSLSEGQPQWIEIWILLIYVKAVQ